MKSKDIRAQTLAICFGQFGPYHHARFGALQQAAREMEDGSAAEYGKLNADDCRHTWRVLPVQIAAATTTYEWKSEQGAWPPARRAYGSERSREQGAWSLESDRKAARSEYGAQACFWAK